MFSKYHSQFQGKQQNKISWFIFKFKEDFEMCIVIILEPAKNQDVPEFDRYFQGKIFVFDYFMVALHL